MALPAKKQFKYWGITSAVLAILLWSLGDVLLPFVLGAAIAYMIDPVADRLEALGLSRTAATSLIVVVSVLLFLLMLLIVLPTLITQLADLVRILPELFRDLRSFAQTHFPSVFTEGSRAQQTIASIAGTLQGKGIDLAEGIVGSAASVLKARFGIPSLSAFARKCSISSGISSTRSRTAGTCRGAPHKR